MEEEDTSLQPESGNVLQTEVWEGVFCSTCIATCFFCFQW